MGDAPQTGTPGRRRKAGGSGRVAINTLSNWVAMGVEACVRIFLLAFLYKKLGNDDYGVYQVAMSITSMTSFLQFGLSGAILRYAAEGIAAGDWKRVSETVSVVRTLTLVMGAVAWGICIFVSIFMLDVLGIPEETQASAARMLRLTGLVAACHLAGISYYGALRAKQRYDLANGIRVGEHLLMAVLIVVVFSSGWVGLGAVGLSMAVPAVLTVVALAWAYRRQLPEARLSLLSFSRETIKDVFSFSGWLAVVAAAKAVFSQAGAPLVSAVLGVGQVSLMAVPRQMAAQMMRLVSGFTQTIRPVLTVRAVRGDRKGVADLYQASLRFTSLLVALPVVLLLTFGRPIIGILTGPEIVDQAYPVLVLYTALFACTLLGLPANSLILAVGRIRGVAIWRAVALLLGVVLGFGVVTVTDWGILGLVAALNLPTAVFSLFYLSYRAQQETDVSVAATILRCMAPAVLLAAVPAALGWGLQQVWPATAWTLVPEVLAAAVPYTVLMWWLVLTDQERQMVRDLVGRAQAKVTGGGADGGAGGAAPPNVPPLVFDESQQD